MDKEKFIGRFPVFNAAFKYQKSRFDGKGFYEWNPENGVNVFLHVGSDEFKFPGAVSFGSNNRIRKSAERKCLNLYEGDRKIKISGLYIDEAFSIKINKTLEVKSDEIIIFERSYNDSKSDFWQGEVLLNISLNGKLLPDMILNQEIIGELTKKNIRRGAFVYENSGVKVTGKLLSEDELVVKYQFCKNLYSKDFAFKFGIGLKYSISFLTGTEANILINKFQNRSIIINQLSRREKLITMHLFKSLDQNVIIESKIIGELAIFFTKGMTNNKLNEAYISCKIMDQLIESEKQSLYVAQEILIGTVFEAIFRTLLNKPYLSKGKSLNFQNLRNLFKKSANLSDKWDDILIKSETAFNEIRHRNAHLDWINNNKSYYDKNIANTFNSVYLLIHFYKLLILHFADIFDEDPKLPIRME